MIELLNKILNDYSVHNTTEKCTLIKKDGVSIGNIFHTKSEFSLYIDHFLCFEYLSSFISYEKEFEKEGFGLYFIYFGDKQYVCEKMENCLKYFKENSYDIPYDFILKNIKEYSLEKTINNNEHPVLKSVYTYMKRLNIINDIL